MLALIGSTDWQSKSLFNSPLRRRLGRIGLLLTQEGRLMAQSYSARSRAIEPFHVMALLARANELQAAGHDVIHLGK